MVANELTAMPGLLDALRAAIALGILGVLPGRLVLELFHRESGLSLLENAVSSALLSLLVLAIAGIALVFSFGLREYSLLLTLAAIGAAGYLHLKRKA